MSKPIPKIAKYMTAIPLTIGSHQTLAHAHEVMREHRIRHLPVLEAGKLVGVISDRDLHMVESLKDVNPEKVLVAEAMTQDPYIVSPDADLDEVVSEMAEHKYGSAVIMQNSKLVGIFTTVDALQTLSDLLHGRLAK